MATIDDKKMIDQIIANNGYFDDDPRVAMIVEYTNAYNRQTWGVTWSNEHPVSQRRYLDSSPYVRNPKVIWQATRLDIETLEEAIRWKVIHSAGVRSTHLLADLAVEHLNISMDIMKETILDMIAKHQIIEIEYIIAGKSRSFFLPAGTEIRIVQ